MICSSEYCNKKAIGMVSVQTNDMKKQGIEAMKGTIKMCEKHLKESSEYDT